MDSLPNPVDLVVELTGNPIAQPVVVLPSVGGETVAVVDDQTLRRLIQESDGLIVKNGKTTVMQISTHDLPGGGKGARIVLPPSGRVEKIRLGQPQYENVAAGSAVNVACALQSLSRVSAGIVGAVGRGAGGTALINSLEAFGFRSRAMLHRSLPDGDGQGGTAQSLWLKTPDGWTISFSFKPPYLLPEAILAYIRDHLSARVVVCTGFMPYEFGLIKAVLEAKKTPQAMILSPHQNCFETPEGRRQCLQLASTATLFHVNGDELAALLEISNSNWHTEKDSDVKDILARIGSEMVCVTLSEHGSVTYIHEGRQIVRQAAHKVDHIRNPIGAGDVHLAALIYYLWIRNRPISFRASLDMAAWVAAQKLEAGGKSGRVLRPPEGIPASANRKDVVHAAETRAKATG